MAYWLFQGNPKYYRILDAIADLEAMPWLVTRYDQEITEGDGVLVWMAGTEAGIYAIAEVIAKAEVIKKPPDLKYWLDKSRLGRPQAMIRFTHKLVESPLKRVDLKQDPVLKDLMVIRQPNATNYRILAEQWRRVEHLVETT